MENRLKKNTYFVSLGLLVQMLLSLALVPFAARYLGDKQYGHYGLASTLMFFVFLFNDFGVNSYLTREIARNREKAPEFVSNAIVLKILLMVVDLVLLFLFLTVSGYPKVAKYAIMIFAFYGLLSSFVKLGIGIFEAFERMEYEAIVLISEKILITGLGIYFLVNGKGLITLCMVFVASGIFSLILTYVLLRKKFVSLRLSFDWLSIKNLFRRSLPFGYSMILAMIYNYIGFMLLSFWVKPEVLGWYFAAVRLLAQTNIIPTILSTSMFPALSRAYVYSKAQFEYWFTKGMKYLLFLAVPLALGTTILARPLVLLIFGDQFMNTVPVLRILAWNAGMLFFNIYFAAVLKAGNKQNLLVIIQLISLVLNVILNYLLIKKYSYIGAAWANLLTESFIFVICYVYISAKLASIKEYGFILKTMLSASIMTLFVIRFANANIIYIAPLAGIIYVITLYLSKGFTIREIVLLKAK